MDPRLWRSSRREYGDRVPGNVGGSNGRSRRAAGRPWRQCCARGRLRATAILASSGHRCRAPPSPRTRDPVTELLYYDPGRDWIEGVKECNR